MGERRNPLTAYPAVHPPPWGVLSLVLSDTHRNLTLKLTVADNHTVVVRLLTGLLVSVSPSPETPLGWSFSTGALSPWLSALCVVCEDCAPGQHPTPPPARMAWPRGDQPSHCCSPACGGLGVGECVRGQAATPGLPWCLHPKTDPVHRSWANGSCVRKAAPARHVLCRQIACSV